jgi:ornithine cyclodeaminase
VTRLGFLGTGLIARYVYAFFHGMGWDIAQIVCADAQRTYAEQFAAIVRATGQCDITVYDRAEDVLRVCDVTVLATTAATPHIHTADVLAYNPLFLHISLRDLAPDLIGQAQNIVDDVEHVLQAQTSVHLAVQTMGQQRCITGTLGAVLAGTCQVSEAAPLTCSPFGLGILDLAVGQYVYEQARAQGTYHSISGFFYERTRWGPGLRRM